MTTSSSRNTSKPSSRACLACRNKHVRCDGESPRCMRCSESGNECTYVQSKRGTRRNLARASGPTVTESPTPAREYLGAMSMPRSLHDTAMLLSDHIRLPQADHRSDQFVVNDSGSISRPVDHERHDDNLVVTYYQTVHPAHPFVLPYSLYQQDRTRLPEHLLDAMRFLACHHTSEDPCRYYRRVNKVYDADTSCDGFKVQTLLLLTLVSYARFERDIGNTALSAALDLALKIGLNSDNFAPDHNRIYRESWRRTWWELFTISSLISLTTGLKCHVPFPDDMKLPTHDDQYERGRVDLVGTNMDMQQRFISDDFTLWSSFAYRVEAVRILNSVLALSTPSTVDEEFETVRASITSFVLSIPKDKTDGLKQNGEVDEVMSQAFMVVHLASICLHFGRSDLADIPGLATVCGNDRVRSLMGAKSRIHRTACLGAAKGLVSLIAVRSSFQTLSPCFSCGIAFAAVVQLGECRLDSTLQTRHLTEQLKLQLTVLKLLGDTWPVANVIRGQLAQFCREIFPLRSAMSTISGMPSNITEEPWMQDLMTETPQLPLDDFSILGMGMNHLE